MTFSYDFLTMWIDCVDNKSFLLFFCDIICPKTRILILLAMRGCYIMLKFVGWYMSIAFAILYAFQFLRMMAVGDYAMFVGMLF